LWKLCFRGGVRIKGVAEPSHRLPDVPAIQNGLSRVQLVTGKSNRTSTRWDKILKVLRSINFGGGQWVATSSANREEAQQVAQQVKEAEEEKAVAKAGVTAAVYTRGPGSFACTS
jgi:hypothetical protein